MMTQSDLLERAKQGNPEAIAALMNLVLEPRGVSAQANLQNSCLHVFFTSEQLLSQSTLASFVRTGMASIAAQSIQTVRLYAKKVGQSSPIWVEEFSLNAAIHGTGASASGEQAAISPSVAAPPETPIAPVAAQLHQPQAQMASLRAIARSLQPPKPSTPVPLGTSSSQAVSFDLSGGLATGAIANPPPTANPPSQPTLTKRPTGKKKRVKRATSPGQKLGRPPRRRRVAKPYVLAGMIGAGAFLIGGVWAISARLPGNARASSQARTESLTASQQSLLAPADSSKATIEQSARQYMAQMNKAQQKFYDANKRFAANLEELERSASIMSQSSHYTYRLVTRDRGQAVLTATPKDEGLKSFSGAMFLAETAQGSDSVAGLVCESTQPSTYPPVLPQEAGAVIQCPTDAINVPY